MTSVLDENPLMPSGAALFVSAMVMLLDFSRPKWQPITAQAKDFVVNCLDMCVPSPADACQAGAYFPQTRHTIRIVALLW